MQSTLLRHLQYIVGAFFCCHNLSMDILKLCDCIFENEDLQDIPVDYVFRVVCAVFEVINSGKCYLDYK